MEYKGKPLPDAWAIDPTVLTLPSGEQYASFMRSPDKTELWCVYHGMKEVDENCTDWVAPRYLNLQKVDFDEKGFPVLGKPIGYETEITPPSGEKG